jgi:hypothetical protein
MFWRVLLVVGVGGERGDDLLQVVGDLLVHLGQAGAPGGGGGAPARSLIA